MKIVFGYIYRLKDYYRYLFLLLLIASIVFDLFIERPEEITGAKIKFLWGIVIFIITLFLIIFFKIVSFIFYREDS